MLKPSVTGILGNQTTPMARTVQYLAYITLGSGMTSHVQPRIITFAKKGHFRIDSFIFPDFTAFNIFLTLCMFLYRPCSIYSHQVNNIMDKPH